MITLENAQVMIILALLLSLSFIVVSAQRFKLHPFLGLLGGAVIFALLSGMDLTTLVKCINEGFGGIMGGIGLIILFGVMIGTFLERSGGALVLANKILSWVGEKYVTLAMLLTGYVISIPVFADSGFVIMSPLNKVLSRRSAMPIAATTAALAIGLLASHVMVPPTPGPVAATEILGASLGKVMIWGLVVSLLSCFVCYVVIIRLVSKIEVSPTAASTEISTVAPSHNVSAGMAFLPILIPIFLIVLGTLSNMPSSPFGNDSFASWIRFFGTPAIALLIGLITSFLLPQKFEKQMLSTTGWLGDAVKEAAPILLITGAGGIFGQVLKTSALGDMIGDVFQGSDLGLLIPFLLAAALKTCQGSSTVALLTTASIVSSLLPSLGLDSEWMTTLTVLSISAGAAVVSHVNDSFFWVITQMTGFTVVEGYKIQTAMTAVFGCTAMGIILLLSVIF